jgi:ATP-dependent RNA helicase SUPV3L1/SUV3
MITKSVDKQLSLAADGQIHWQEDPSNPLTGPVIGRVEKGGDILHPKAAITADPLPGGEDKEAVAIFVQGWLDRHVQTILAPLFTLNSDEGIDGPAKEIAQAVYNALGIIPRDEVQSLINQLTEETRQPLRNRRLRMGPLLVYLPELNKPASVRLQALLWNLWNGLDLPAIVPADGIVSFSVRDQDIDPKYYRGIGYPVYGPRAIRVDMLDRVVCAVYDNAKDGKLQVQHQMAEWLGSNIADLYEILAAMGHTKVHDPLEEKIKAEEGEEAVSDAPAKQDVKPEENAEDASAEAPEEKPAEQQEQKQEVQKRPELATFRLKRGKASESYTPKARQHPKGNFSSDTKKVPFKKKGKKSDKKKPHDKKRVISTGPKPKAEDSPFAVLQQLKFKDD